MRVRSTGARSARWAWCHVTVTKCTKISRGPCKLHASAAMLMFTLFGHSSPELTGRREDQRSFRCGHQFLTRIRFVDEPDNIIVNKNLEFMLLVSSKQATQKNARGTRRTPPCADKNHVSASRRSPNSTAAGNWPLESVIQHSYGPRRHSHSHALLWDILHYGCSGSHN